MSYHFKIKYKAIKIGETEITAINKEQAKSLLTAALKIHMGEKEGKVNVKILKMEEVD